MIADDMRAIRAYLQELADTKGQMLDARHIETACVLKESHTPAEAAKKLMVDERTIRNRVVQILERTGLNEAINGPGELRCYLLGFLAPKRCSWR